MSMGYLVRQDAPVAWRGMMVVKALLQLLHEVNWGGLDTLVLDLPPGTGDTQLTIAQQVELDGTSHKSRICGPANLIYYGARSGRCFYTSRCGFEGYTQGHIDVPEDGCQGKHDC